MADEFPCPVPPKPPIARQHCRHYSCKMGLTFGPQCAVGRDLSAPAASRACWPSDSTNGATCDKREDWTEEERAAWEAWRLHHMARMVIAFQAIPKETWAGEVACPACGTGLIRYSRAQSNNHLHAACSTPNCFAVMQ